MKRLLLVLLTVACNDAVAADPDILEFPDRVTTATCTSMVWAGNAYTRCLVCYGNQCRKVNLSQ